MEGLEVSIVNSDFIDKIQYRIDSEFYTKEHLEFETYLKGHGFSTLEQLGGKLDCSAFYPSITEYYNFDRQGVPFIRVNEIQNGLVQIVDSTAFLPDFVLKQNSNTIAKAYPDDIIIAKGGNTLAKVGILTDEYPEYAICRDVILVSTKKMTSNMRYAVWAFLHSKFGYKSMLRTASQTGQPHLTLPNILKIMIPVWGEDMISKLCELYNQSNLYKDQSKALYDEAENKLLEELGLKEWKPTQKAVSIKNFSDFAASGRLDAEYYQPKYDDLFVHLKKYETKSLSKIVTIKKSIEPGSDAYQVSGIPFVRVSNLSKFGLSEPDIHLDRTKYETDELKARKDTILLSKDGSVGVAYKLEQDLEAITSGAVLHLTITDGEFMPDYVTLVLNSIIVKMQAERDAGGSIIQHWKPSEIEQVIIPKLSKEQQTQITEKIVESFALKAESKRLLDLAKTAVETAIEKDEMAAMKLLN